MQWYHYVIIVAGAVIFIMLLIALVGGKKKTETPVVEEKPILLAKEKPIPMQKVQPKSNIKDEKKATVVEKPTVSKPVKTEPEDDSPEKYHVSQNKENRSPRYKEWRVRKEGSNKTIKYFQTQKEAIEYADDLAESAGSSVVIHKLDGSIRKQDYSKKG